MLNIHSFIPYRLTTGQKLLPERVLHTARYSASSLNFQYSLFSLKSSSRCLQNLNIQGQTNAHRNSSSKPRKSRNTKSDFGLDQGTSNTTEHTSVSTLRSRRNRHANKLNRQVPKSHNECNQSITATAENR
jgi:hypothetical protein